MSEQAKPNHVISVISPLLCKELNFFESKALLNAMGHVYELAKENPAILESVGEEVVKIWKEWDTLAKKTV